jgi:hypothetical protein
VCGCAEGLAVRVFGGAEWYSDEFARLLKRADLRKIRLHDSRHTTLRLMEKAGVASPAGGGMGVAEAGLILALTAGGITKNNATAAVFVQRPFSAYLPPIAGWFTLMWMRKREYL